MASIGPYFFDGTLNGDRYRQMLTELVVPELRKKRELSSTWFQQNGATCHTALETMQLLRKHFSNRLILRGANLVWPSRSPDLSCPDFFLWGQLKTKVYINKPWHLTIPGQHQKRNSQNSPTTLKKVIENFNKIKGGHLHYVIFKTK
ncbi:hypothetical protein PGB90_009633 [Kerria lacca]